MKAYVVSYDCHNADETCLAQAIKGASQYWSHHLRATWLIFSEYTTEEITAFILPHLGDEPRRLLVVEANPHNINGWLPPDAWNWFRSRASDIGFPVNP